MSLSKREQRIIDEVFRNEKARTVLRVVLNRNGGIDIWHDRELLPVYQQIILGDLILRASAEEQGRRRREAHAS